MQLGKLALRLPLADVLRDQQQQNGLVVEAVMLEDILALSALPALHRDPFDRIIVAQANRGGFHLVTHDPERSPAMGLGQVRLGGWHEVGFISAEPDVGTFATVVSVASAIIL